MKEKNLSRADKKRVKKELKSAIRLTNEINDAEGKQRKKKIIISVIALVAILVPIYILDKVFEISKEYANVINIIVKIFSWGMLITVIVMILYLYNLFTGNVSAFFHRHKKAVLLCSTFLCGAFITYLCLFTETVFNLSPTDFNAFEKELKTLFPPTELFGFYTAQLSLTFISISVMSVLSDKSVIIYWSNVSEDRLIEPTFTCFAAYTYYSIAATVGAGIGVALKESLLFIVFFVLNVLSLIALTLSITDVYYSRDTKKKKLAAKLRKIQRNAAVKGYYLEKYNRTMLSFAKNISFAAQNGDLLYLREVYELVVTQPKCFENPTAHFKEGKIDITKGREVIEALLSTLDDTTFPIFAQAMDQTLEIQRAAVTRYKLELEQGVGILASSTLESDSLFWEVLSENEYFLNRISRSPEIDREYTKKVRLLKWIAERMQLDYEQNAALYRTEHPDEELPYDNPDWTTTEKVMEYAFAETNTQDNRLFVSLAKLVCAAFEQEKAADFFITLFDKPPYVYYLLDQIEFFELQDNLREKMNRIFRKYHPDEALRKTPKWATKKQEKA